MYELGLATNACPENRRGRSIKARGMPQPQPLEACGDLPFDRLRQDKEGHVSRTIGSGLPGIRGQVQEVEHRLYDCLRCRAFKQRRSLSEVGQSVTRLKSQIGKLLGDERAGGKSTRT